MNLTHGQSRALGVLLQRHEKYPEHQNFATVFLGTSTAATLRKLTEVGLVTVTRGARGSRQFFAITDAGRAALNEEKV